MSDLSHSIAIDPDSRAIRFYLWLYDADRNNINTCKLFWAFVFAPLVLILRYAVLAGIAIGDRVQARRRSKVKAAEETTEDGFKSVLVTKAQPSRFERALERVAGALSAFWAKYQRPLQIAGLTLIGAYVAFMLVLFVIAVINKPLVGVIVVGSVVGIAGLAWLAIRLSPALAGFLRLLGKLGRGVHDHTCARVVIDNQES